MIRATADRIDWSRTRVHRTRNDGLATATPFLDIPPDGAVRWERGVFLPATLSSPQTEQCRIVMPLAEETRLTRTTPLELHALIAATAGSDADSLPFALLTGETGAQYQAHLYPDTAGKSADGARTIDARILDADLSRVAPGRYRLAFGIGNALCDSGKSLRVDEK